MYHSRFRFSEPLERELSGELDMVLWTVLAIFSLLQMKILEPEIIALQHCLKAC